jgi:hypothetical protein
LEKIVSNYIMLKEEEEDALYLSKNSKNSTTWEFTAKLGY